MIRLCLRLPIAFVIALLCCPAFAETGVTADKITFGQIVALEGNAAEIGNAIRIGILAAFEEANRAGGVKGRKFALVSEDDSYDPTKAIEAANKLIKSGEVFALIGSMGTPTSAVIAPMASRAQVPFLAPFTGAEFLREPFDPNVVNIRPPYLAEGEVLVERLVKDRGISRFALLYQDDAMGRAVLAGVQQALDRRGLKPVAEGIFERDTLAVKSALLKIQRGKPEVVILLGMYKPCAEFIKLARHYKLNALLALGSYNGGNALPAEAGPAAAGVIVTQAVPPPEDGRFAAGARFQAALKAVAPEQKPGFVSYEAYLAGRLAIAALEKQKGEPERRDYLRTIFSNTYNLDGISYSFQPDSNQAMASVFLTVIQPDGTFRLVNDLSATGGSW
jgi:branched-chain amino acid transport system substrate-binding protein